MKRKTLVIGAGPHWAKGEDTILLDIHKFANIDVAHDLNVIPWPFQDGEFKHMNASHVLEHLNTFPAVMDEAWRLLNPGGSFMIQVPYAGDLEMAFTDPTHTRFFTEWSFLNYITVEGVHNFGYCQHAWSPIFLQRQNGEITVMLYPIPDEFLTDETLKNLQTKLK